MHSRNQYFKFLQKKYLQTKSKEEKSAILDGCRRNTGQNRKCVILQINSPFSGGNIQKKTRKRIYDGQVREAMTPVWEIFGHPCEEG